MSDSLAFRYNPNSDIKLAIRDIGNLIYRLCAKSINRRDISYPILEYSLTSVDYYRTLERSDKIRQLHKPIQ